MKSRKGIDKKLDDTWSKLVKLRAGMKCEIQGCNKKVLNSHHIYSRSKKSTRWLPENGICLCVGHHTFSSSFSAHKTPVEFVRWLDDYKGKYFMDKLSLTAHSIKKYYTFEKEELLKDLQNQIKELS